MISALAFVVAATAPASLQPATPFVYAHHAVSTSSPVLQAMFDRGLTLYYAYNGAQGVHVFQAAVDRDPNFAMGYWGLALSYGPDINTDITEERFLRAHAAIEKAASLLAGVTDSERAYIEALRVRYAGTWRDRERDERSYRTAMAAAVARFPSDDDLAALYAEALLEKIGPTAFNAGTNVPAGSEAATMVAVLDRVIARDPKHIMANHLQIHLFESALDHSRAVAAAKRLDAMAFAPEDEHLAHMPAHTWIDVGEYARAVASSKRAIALFDQYLAQPDADHSHKGYLGHDIDVGWGAALMLGSYANAKWFADRLSALNGGDLYRQVDALRFGDQRSIEQMRSATPASKPAQDAVAAFESYFAILRGDAAAAKAGFASWFDPKEKSPLAWAMKGRLELLQDDRKAAEADFHKAAALEDAQFGGEELPRFPVAEIEGYGYYRNGNFSAAEAAFRATLKRYPNDPRAAYGLSQTLVKEGKAAEAQRLLASFQKTWSGSDTHLSINAL
jgi:hypothetical protein